MILLCGTASPVPRAEGSLQETPGPAGLTHTGLIHRLAASLKQPVMLGRGAEEEEEGSNNLILGAGRRESKPTARWFNITGPLARPKRSSPPGREEQRKPRVCNSLPAALPGKGSFISWASGCQLGGERRNEGARRDLRPQLIVCQSRARVSS